LKSEALLYRSRDSRMTETCAESVRCGTRATRLCIGPTLGVGRFYLYDLLEQQRQLILDDFGVSGFAFDEPGSLTLVNNQGVWVWDRSANPAHAVGEVEGKKLRLNYCIADPVWRLLGDLHLTIHHRNMRQAVCS
jgi:hypothetical protein